jgi:hypothetical protein
MRYYSELETPSGTTVAAESKNHARKMYQAELLVRPGIGRNIGSAARTPSMAKQPAITKITIILGSHLKTTFSTIQSALK